MLQKETDSYLAESLLRGTCGKGCCSGACVDPVMAAPAEAGALLCTLHLFRALPVRDASVASLQSAVLLALILFYQVEGDAFARLFLRRAMRNGLNAIKMHKLSETEIDDAFWQVVADYPTEDKPSCVAANLQKDTLKTALAEIKADAEEERVGEEIAATLATGATLGEVISADASRKLPIAKITAILTCYRDACAASDVEFEIMLGSALGVKAADIGARRGMTEDAVKQAKHRLKARLFAVLGRKAS